MTCWFWDQYFRQSLSYPVVAAVRRNAETLRQQALHTEVQTKR